MQTAGCCKNNNKSQRDFKEVIEFLKIISEPNRLKILCLLRNNDEQCVCEIRETLDLPQNLTSHHLKTLKESGLIKSKQEGRKIIYCSSKKTVQKYYSLLNNFLISNL